MRASRLFRALLLVAISGCYQAHERIEERPRDSATSLDGATIGDAGRLCGCPGSPTARVCVLPLMCCPVTRTCEDPARFNCSGSSRPCE